MAETLCFTNKRESDLLKLCLFGFCFFSLLPLFHWATGKINLHSAISVALLFGIFGFICQYWRVTRTVRVVLNKSEIRIEYPLRNRTKVISLEEINNVFLTDIIHAVIIEKTDLKKINIGSSIVFESGNFEVGENSLSEVQGIAGERLRLCKEILHRKKNK